MKCRFSTHFMLPKRRFWKSEPTFPDAFSKHSSAIRSPNLVLTPLKSASKTHPEMLVRPSKIFVWEGYICISSFVPPSFGEHEIPESLHLLLSMFLATLSCHFLTEGERATFLARHSAFRGQNVW